jgi:glyoxylase-like metal-dependent hydrolase (beta-lactamase superfamily II)
MSPILIHAGNPGAMTGPGNNTWLLMGAEPALIDAGVGGSPHVEAVARALQGRELSRVLVTHGHADHASGAPALRARWPNVELAKFLAQEAGSSDPAIAEDAPWRALADGERITAGESLLTVIHTPGHALDHVCFWNPDTRELFAGDMLSLGTTIMIPAGRGGGLRAYMASLERLAALAPARVYPGHGPVIEQPVKLITEYLAHRRMREAQVRECLAAGVSDPDAIVRRLYPELAAGLAAAARATVEAHIEKLREDKL